MNETDENYFADFDSLLQFGWIEYVVFFIMMGGSAMIGIYFGFIKKDDNTITEYMLGGKRMAIFPVALSLMASHVSGITFVGTPSETYLYGTQFYATIFCNLIVTVIIKYFYLPVFYNTQTPSVFEYLERRFNSTVRSLASLIFAFALLLYIPVVIYVPALAFNQVTGMHVHTLAPIICVVCIFYTTLGGLKAVVWSDTLQSAFIFFSTFIIIIIGIIQIGGIGTLIDINQAGERLELFNMDPNPLARNTFFTVTFGAAFNWLALLAVNPVAIQRFICVATFKDAQKVTIIFCIGIIAIKSIVVTIGLIMYAQYHDCDPVSGKMIKKLDQLFPYYVMDVASHIPGLSGLFISGVVSAALSTMSTGLNTVSGTIYQDFIKKIIKRDLSEPQANFIMKCLVVGLGFASLGMVFVVEKLGAVMQMSISLSGITSGPTLFLFTFGMFLPWATSKGAIFGALSSLAFMTVVVGGSQNAIANKQIQFPGKITSLEGCPANFSLNTETNQTIFGYPGVGTKVIVEESVPYLFRISYLWYCGLGLFTGLIVGCLVSYFDNQEENKNLNPELLIPQMRRFVKKREEYTMIPKNDNHQCNGNK